MIRLTRPQERSWPIRMMNRVRIMLRFEADRRMLRIGRTVLARGVIEIGGQKLEPRLRSPGLHRPPRFGIVNAGRQRKLSRVVIQNKVLVITDRLARLPKVCPNLSWLCEIKRSASNRLQFPSRNV